VRSPHNGRLHRVLKLALVALQHLCGLLVQRVFRVGVLRWPRPRQTPTHMHPLCGHACKYPLIFHESSNMQLHYTDCKPLFLCLAAGGSMQRQSSVF